MSKVGGSNGAVGVAPKAPVQVVDQQEMVEAKWNGQSIWRRALQCSDWWWQKVGSALHWPNDQYRGAPANSVYGFTSRLLQYGDPHVIH